MVTLRRPLGANCYSSFGKAHPPLEHGHMFAMGSGLARRHLVALNVAACLLWAGQLAAMSVRRGRQRYYSKLCRTIRAGNDRPCVIARTSLLHMGCDPRLESIQTVLRTSHHVVRGGAMSGMADATTCRGTIWRVLSCVVHVAKT